MNKVKSVRKFAGRVALLGAGKIGEALLAGLVESGFVPSSRLTATTLHAETASVLSSRLPVRVTNDNRVAVHRADVVVLAVKPKQVTKVCAEIRAELPRHALIISLVTGVPAVVIEQSLGDGCSVVRAMPNTPIQIRRGMTVLCAGSRVSPRQMKLARDLFATVGETVVVEEELMNASTGLSASGPAYIYVIIESLAEAGVKVGLSRELATRLAAQTTMGAASMVLASGKHPALLKDNVTTPAGVTIDGLMELEAGGLRVALIKAIMMSTRRAAEIQEHFVATLQERATQPRATQSAPTGQPEMARKSKQGS